MAPVLDNALHWLHLFQGDGGQALLPEDQLPPEGVRGRLSVCQAGVDTEVLVASLLHCLLQGQDSLRIVSVALCPGTAAELVHTAGIDGGIGGELHGVKGPVVGAGDPLFNFSQANAPHPADGAGKVVVNDLSADAHRLKDLGALVVPTLLWLRSPSSPK